MFTHRLTRAGAVALAVAAAAAPAAVAKPTDAPADYKLPHGFQSADTATPQRGIYQPMKPEDQPQPRQDLRHPDTIDMANGRGTESVPKVVVVQAPQPTPQPAADGMDWADIGLGAGTVTGLALVALGGGLLIVRRRGTGQLAG